MKRIKLTLVLILVSVTMYGQGIAVQGIARDTQKRAIANERKEFTFFISGETSEYKETKNIATDVFGMFSHVVGTGTKISARHFDELNFAEKLTLIVSADGVGEVYKKEFNYMPQAHYIMNGVPVGTIIAHMSGGSDGIYENPKFAPKGWLLCNGNPIDPKHKKLIALIGTDTPDLRGRFLRGAGTGKGLDGKIDEVELGRNQEPEIKGHSHGVGALKTSETGSHSHSIEKFTKGNAIVAGTGIIAVETASILRFPTPTTGAHSKTTSESDEHNHGIEGETDNSGSFDTRPYTYVVNYIIKY